MTSRSGFGAFAMTVVALVTGCDKQPPTPVPDSRSATCEEWCAEVDRLKGEGTDCWAEWGIDPGDGNCVPACKDTTEQGECLKAHATGCAELTDTSCTQPTSP